MDLRPLGPDVITRILKEGGLLIDLRPIDDYLRFHFSGSIPLLYEDGPGLPGRARDLLPLDARLVLVEDEQFGLDDAAASFRGKGFDVVGYLPDGVHGSVAGALNLVSTPDIAIDEAGSLVLVDVADPGTVPQLGVSRIPAETLWLRAREIDSRSDVGVLAGWGVWAAAAVGILEKLDFSPVSFVRTRVRGAVPPTAGPEVFRVGGPS